MNEKQRIARLKKWLAEHTRDWPAVLQPIGGLHVDDVRAVIAAAERVRDLEILETALAAAKKAYLETERKPKKP